MIELGYIDFLFLTAIALAILSFFLLMAGSKIKTGVVKSPPITPNQIKQMLEESFKKLSEDYKEEELASIMDSIEIGIYPDKHKIRITFNEKP